MSDVSCNSQMDGLSVELFGRFATSNATAILEASVFSYDVFPFWRTVRK